MSANGLTAPFGRLPAEKALNRVAPSLPRRLSAMIERAELPVQRNRTLYFESLTAMPYESQQSGAQQALVFVAAVGLGLVAHEGAHELAFDLRRDRVDIDALAGQKLASVLHIVDPSRLDPDRLESRGLELPAINALVQRAGDAASPEQDVATNLLGDCAARRDIRNG